jgi:uncharacterized protein
MTGNERGASTSTNKGSFDLRCPKDAGPMQRVSIGSMVIDRCASCGALWFDVGEIEKVLRMKRKVSMELDAGAVAPRQAEGATRREGLKCPRDGESLKRRAFPEQSHIMVDECTFCHGMLLDSGELKDASDFTIAERVKSFFA